MLQCQNTPDCKVIRVHFTFLSCTIKIWNCFWVTDLVSSLLPGVDTAPALLFYRCSAGPRLLPLIGCISVMRISKGLANVMDFCVIQMAVPVTKYRRWVNLDDLLEGPMSSLHYQRGTKAFSTRALNHNMFLKANTKIRLAWLCGFSGSSWIIFTDSIRQVMG